jgi:hypothetical protein
LLQVTFDADEAHRWKLANEFVTKRKVEINNADRVIYLRWNAAYRAARLEKLQIRRIDENRKVSLTVLGENETFGITSTGDLYRKTKSATKTTAQRDQEYIGKIKSKFLGSKFKTLEYVDKGFWHARGNGTKTHLIFRGVLAKQRDETIRYYWFHTNVAVKGQKNVRILRAVEIPADNIEEYRAAYQVRARRGADLRAVNKVAMDAAREEKRIAARTKVGYLVVQPFTEFSANVGVNNKPGKIQAADPQRITFSYTKRKDIPVYVDQGLLYVYLKVRNAPLPLGSKNHPIDKDTPNWTNFYKARVDVDLGDITTTNAKNMMFHYQAGGRNTASLITALPDVASITRMTAAIKQEGGASKRALGGMGEETEAGTVSKRART